MGIGCHAWLGMRNPGPLRGGMILLAILLLITAWAAVCSARTGLADGKDRLKDDPWIYLRDGQPVQTGEALVELAAVGDTNLGRNVNAQTAFHSSSAWLRTADITFANLECALTERPVLPGANGVSNSPYRLVAPPSAARALAGAGIDIAGLANNHTLDAGPEGLADTARALELANVAGLGAGNDSASASAPLVKTIRGLKVAFLAFNAIASPDPAQPGWTVAPWQRAAVIAAVRRAAIQSDAVVVSLHWGYEYQPQASSAQVAIAQALIAAGADLIIGHHPHVTQELLLQQRADGSSGLAALSLGNFVFDQGSTSPAGEKVKHGLALRAFFDRDGLRAVQVLPIHAGLRPALEAPDLITPSVINSAPLWEKIHFSCAAAGCRETQPGSTTAGLSTGAEAFSLRFPHLTGAATSGMFRSGQIDLDGDRQPEEVRLENFRISIYSHGRLDWQSPPEWRMLDLSLGDPDGDGRGELVLALEKPDKKGVIQSHPFVIGYRGGVYRTVWGGSPVRDPVKEVELADINGDGQTELLVLEEERGGKGRAVTVWHWHGWGFSLDWRSAYAEYEQMVTSGQEIWVKKLHD
jgi:poly-gamma-glutamate capsule biosynthesis protein CapA/YwtB (metallophosphatase superfamily)